jgi:hypothetical protein
MNYKDKIMQLTTQQLMQVGGGNKTEAVDERAEDIVSSLAKIETASVKMTKHLQRLEEDFELVKNKVRR